MKRSHRASSKRFATFRRSLHDSRRPLPKGIWIVGIAVLVLLLVIVAQSIQRHDALVDWRKSLEKNGVVFSWPAWEPSWPSLPRVRNGTVGGDLRGPYAFAALNAERLQFIPCYCGCAKEGHGSALQCFVKGFTPKGVPVWSDHAFTCPLCVNILREVLLMTNRGMPLRAIREAIDEHHQSVFATSTPTPAPQ